MNKKFIILFSIFVSCTQTHANSPMPTPDQCLAAEIHLQNLCDEDHKSNKHCCQVVNKTRNGKSYAAFCAEQASKNISLNPGCLCKITSCNQIDICTDIE